MNTTADTGQQPSGRGKIGIGSGSKSIPILWSQNLTHSHQISGFEDSKQAGGVLALVLHGHLPFVRHPEQPSFHEENWLFEAMAECYLPLLHLCNRLQADGVEFRATISLTPPLCAMLQDRLLQERARRHWERARDLAAEESRRRVGEPDWAGVLAFYERRYQWVLDSHEHTCRRDLVAAFRRLQQRGCLEIMASAATHGYLPLMEVVPGLMRAQVLAGRDAYVAAFGESPRGIWLPECAYSPAVEPLLREAEIRWTVVDAHGLMFGCPRPRFAVYAPCFTPGGIAVFGRDRDASRQVWSAEEGYPGDPVYRDFYRDLGLETEEERLQAIWGKDFSPGFTGVKCHRITGHGEHKDVYRRDPALALATAHAEHFVEERGRRLDQLRAEGVEGAVLVCPFDAELFGHWWFEGSEFLDGVLRKTAAHRMRLETLSGYLRKHQTLQVVQPTPSSWGHEGYSSVWLNESNAWIYPRLHAAARRMAHLVKKRRRTLPSLTERFLRQMGRELLLASSSDWAFLITVGTAGDYATARVKDHLRRFEGLADALEAGRKEESLLAECEERHNLLPDLNWRYFGA